MIIDSLGIGGAEVTLKTLSTAMVEMGHNVVVLVIRDDVVIDMDDRVNVKVFGYKKYRWKTSVYVNSIKLRKFVKRLEEKCGGFHLKISNLTLSNKLTSLAGISDMYYCIHENLVASNLERRSNMQRYARVRKIRRLYNNKDIIGVSKGVNDGLRSIPSLHCKSFRTIYNPIDMDEIKKQSNEYNPYRDIRYIVHVGRFSVQQKRHDILLDAYKKSGIDHKLVLVGDGPDRERITEMIKQMKLDDKVIMTGFINNPYPLIRAAKLLVLSSDYEGFGVVLAEALCLETAIVSTDCKSGPSEIMISSLSDYLVPTGDSVRLASMIDKAISDVENNDYPFKSADLLRFSPTSAAKQYIDLVD